MRRKMIFFAILLVLCAAVSSIILIRHHEYNTLVQNQICSNDQYVCYMNTSNRICLLDVSNQKISFIKGKYHNYTLSDVDDQYLCLVSLSGTYMKIPAEIVIIDFFGKKQYQFSVNAATASIYKNEIFFPNQDDNNKIYKINLSSGICSKVSHEQADNLDIYKDYIYFANQNEGHYLYRMKVSRADSELICKSLYSYTFDIKGDIVYLKDYNDNYLYKVNEQTGQLIKIFDQSIRTFTICGNFVYYIKYYDFDDRGKDARIIYHFKLDDSTKERVAYK